MIELNTRIRMFARYFMSTLEEALCSSSDYDDVTISVYPVNGHSCMRACKSTHAENDLWRSRARLRYSAAMRVAILVYRSCCLPFVLVLFSRLDPPSLFVHPLPSLQSSFFSALPSLRVRSTPRALLFRFCSTRAFCPRVNSRARG